MKHVNVWWLVIVIACTISMLTLSIVVAQGNGTPKEKQVSVIGTMTCSVCRLTHPGKACPPGCCEDCIKNGDPVLFTDQTGNQYVLAPKEGGPKLMTDERYALLNQPVRVTGQLLKGKGVQFIVVDTIAKAPKTE